MPSTLSKVGIKIVGKLPPEWILFYIKLSKGQKLAIVGSFLGILGLVKETCFKKRKRKSRSPHQGERRRTPGVNLEFFKQMKFLLKLMIPTIWSKQIALLVAHTGTLVARTFLSIYVAKLEGKIVKEIVQK